MSRTLAWLTLAMLAFTAPAALAECDHISSACPTVSDWRIEGHAGGFTVTTTLLQRFTHSDWARLFACDTCGNDGFWTMGLFLRPAGSTGFFQHVDPLNATVTDSTFRLDVLYPSGTYDFSASVDGHWPGENDYCPSLDTLGVFTIGGTTPALRASWGAVKSKYAR